MRWRVSIKDLALSPTPVRSCVALVVGVVCAAAVATGSAAAADHAYRDNSGLPQGRYVWQPTLQERGSVVVVAVPAKNMLHVFRNGIEIGIARAISSGASPRAPLAVFMIDPRERTGSGSVAVGRRLVPVRAIDGSPVLRNAAFLRLRQDFTSLLSGQLGLGAFAVVADSLLEPRVTATDWPNVDQTRLIAVNETAQRATDQLGLSAEPASDETPVIIISRADQTAALFVGASRRWTARVSFESAGGDVGTHVLSRLMAPSPLALAGRQFLAISEKRVDGSDGRILRRVATESGSAAGGSAVAVLEGVKFENPADARRADLALGTPGATILITDSATPGDLGSVPERALWAADTDTVAETTPLADERETEVSPAVSGQARAKFNRTKLRLKPAPVLVTPKPRKTFGPRDLPGMD